jgi:hypothetical protein
MFNCAPEFAYYAHSWFLMNDWRKSHSRESVMTKSGCECTIVCLHHSHYCAHWRVQRSHPRTCVEPLGFSERLIHRLAVLCLKVCSSLRRPRFLFCYEQPEVAKGFCRRQRSG